MHEGWFTLQRGSAKLNVVSPCVDIELIQVQTVNEWNEFPAYCLVRTKYRCSTINTIPAYIVFFLSPFFHERADTDCTAWLHQPCLVVNYYHCTRKEVHSSIHVLFCLEWDKNVYYSLNRLNIPGTGRERGGLRQCVEGEVWFTPGRYLAGQG